MQRSATSPLHENNSERAGRIAATCREITFRLPPKPGYIPTGYASEAQHRAEHERLMPLLRERVSARREQLRKQYQLANPRAIPLSTLEARRAKKRTSE